MTYHFTHDPQNGALYIQFREGRYRGTVPLGELGFGTGVDVDAQGVAQGVEFLSFEEYAETVERASGRLELPERGEDIEAFIQQTKRGSPPTTAAPDATRSSVTGAGVLWGSGPFAGRYNT